MSPVLLYDLQLTEVRDSDAFNRRQVHRRIFAHNSLAPMPRVPATQQLLHVLIVDEDREAADALAELVHHWGHCVQSAYDGAAGLELATAQRPDVLLLGVPQPGLDAFHTARQLREDAGLRKCFIIAVTCHADEACRRQCMKAGIDLCLMKPVDAFVLETLLLLEGERLDNLPTRGESSGS